jgi:hypothetical protein
MKKKTPAGEPTQYLNVDLDIYSSKKLDPLVEALGESVAVLYVGKTTRLPLASHFPQRPRVRPNAVRIRIDGE